MGKLIADVIGAVIVVIVLFGFYRLLKTMLHQPPSTEMTDKDVALYRDAAKILNRLVNATDLAGDFAEDILTTQTRERVATWLTAYKKELGKR